MLIARLWRRSCALSQRRCAAAAHRRPCAPTSWHAQRQPVRSLQDRQADRRRAGRATRACRTRGCRSRRAHGRLARGGRRDDGVELVEQRVEGAPGTARRVARARLVVRAPAWRGRPRSAGTAVAQPRRGHARVRGPGGSASSAGPDRPVHRHRVGERFAAAPPSTMPVAQQSGQLGEGLAGRRLGLAPRSGRARRPAAASPAAAPAPPAAAPAAARRAVEGSPRVVTRQRVGEQRRVLDRAGEDADVVERGRGGAARRCAGSGRSSA